MITRVLKKTHLFQVFFKISLVSVIIFTSTIHAQNQKITTLPDGSIVAGNLGMMQFVIVPLGKSKNLEFYKNTIKQLCEDKKTCFLNFFTNSTNQKISFPLNDKILSEPTLMFKKSAKHQNTSFEWSCRLNLAVKNCF